MRGVLAEVGAIGIPEIIVVNKIDQADPLAVKQILAREPHAVAISAHSGEGVDELALGIEADLPRPSERVDVLLPYARGDLLAKIHGTGEIEDLSHEAEGTHVVARVPGELAHALAAYVV